MAKKVWRIVFLGLGIALFGIVTVGVLRMDRAGKLLPQHETPSTTKVQGASGFVVGTWEGRLAVFVLGEAQPTRVYEVFVASLPPAEQVRLQEGVAVADHLALAALIEDYTG